MTNFFEKLKKGMGAEISSNEGKESWDKKTEKSEEKRPKTKSKKTKGGKNKKIEAKEPILKKEKLKKLEIEVKELPLAKTPEEKEKRTEKEKTELEKKWFEPEGQLTVDVFQTAEEIIIQSAVAGVKPEDLDISVENDVVAIRGVRKRPSEVDGKSYFYQECYWGPFSREIILPEEVDPSHTVASMKNGVLTIRVPKIERDKKRKIVIKEG